MKYLNLDKPAHDPETENCYPDYKIEGGVFISGWKVEKKMDEVGYIPTPEEQPSDEPTLRERLTIMEDAFAELCEVIFNG